MTAKEYLQQLERADVIIEQKMKDPQFIKVLFKRYVEYKGFDKIAVELECSERNVYTIHGQALKDFTEKVLKM